jgi:hypothetical protein
VFTLAAVGFGVTALGYQSKIDDDVAHSGEHFSSDVSHDRDRARLWAYGSAAALAVGIGFAIPTVYFFPKGGFRAALKPLGTGAAATFRW